MINLRLKSIIVGLLILISTKSQAQEENSSSSYHKNIYGEFLGSHILAGVNYDMRLNKGKMNGVGFRVGIGGLSVSGMDTQRDAYATINVMTIPIEFNHLLGNKRSSFVSGIGLIASYASVNVEEEFTNNQYFNDYGLSLSNGFITLGYRFQPLKNGIMFQINWNPIINTSNGFQPYWVGVGLGYGFK